MTGGPEGPAEMVSLIARDGYVDGEHRHDPWHSSWFTCRANQKNEIDPGGGS
jgi:hypothetical protein